MAITITSAPPVTTDGNDPEIPVPVSDCLQWCMEPDAADGITTPGSFAVVEVHFPSTISSIPADGSTITIWGHIFEVDSSLSASTSTAFKILSSGSLTGANFRAMLNANAFFLSNTLVEVDQDTGNLRDTEITWNTCGQQENFTGVAMDFAAITGATGATVTVTNGDTPVYVDGYMLQYRLLKWGTVPGGSALIPVSKLRGIDPRFGCDAISEECVNLMRDAARLIYTPMPDLAIDSEIDPTENTIVGRYSLEYGWTYRDDLCQPQSGTFARSGDVLVLNASFEVEDKSGIDRFWQRPVPGSGILRQDFLTNQPQYHTIGENSFAWLWLLNSFVGTNYLTGSGTGTPFTLDHFRLVIEVYYNGSVSVDTVLTVDYPVCEWFQAMNFNVSPGRVADIDAVSVSTIGKYGVFVYGMNDDNTEFMRLTEELVYGVEHVCQNLTDLYFLTPAGGIGTITADITERTLEQEATEICLDTPCGGTREDFAKYGGRMQVNIRSYERVTLTARQNYGSENLEFFRSFKASPERWIQVVEKEGAILSSGITKTWIAKRFLVDTGGIKIYQNSEYIDLVISGFMTDIPLQTPRNVS